MALKNISQVKKVLNILGWTALGGNSIYFFIVMISLIKTNGLGSIGLPGLFFVLCWISTILMAFLFLKKGGFKQ